MKIDQSERARMENPSSCCHLLLDFFVVGAVELEEERRQNRQRKAAEGVRRRDLHFVEKFDASDGNAALEKDVDRSNNELEEALR